MSLAGVVLAAGRSARMGIPKALLDFRGRPFVTRIVEALAALRPVRPGGVLAWPVDLPHVRIATVERLIEVYRRGRPPAAVPAFGGRRGHPVIWDEALFTALETSDLATRHGAPAILKANEDRLAIVAVDDPAVLDDVNTPEDYERLIREVNRDIY